MNATLSHISRLILTAGLLLTCSTIGVSQQGYKKPPQAVLDILNAPVTPKALTSHTRDNVLLTTGFRYPPSVTWRNTDATPGGLRINPNTTDHIDAGRGRP